MVLEVEKKWEEEEEEEKGGDGEVGGEGMRREREGGWGGVGSIFLFLKWDPRLQKSY